VRGKILHLFPLGALVLGGVLALAFTTTSAPANDQVIPGKFIVLTAAGVDPAEVAAEHGLAAQHVYRSALSGFAAPVHSGKLSDLRNDPRVIMVEAERIYFLDDQETPTGIDRIDADLNSPATGVAVNLDVAIIDSGIDSDHPDLNVGEGRNFSGGPSSKWDDGNGHGTHVAGTVGALDNGIGVVGVAPGVRLHAVKVCKNGGICFTGDIVAGIDWVASQKNSGAIDFAVANMSISTSDDASVCGAGSGAVHTAICGLVNEGVVFVMAAGNDNRLKNAYPEALAVSAAADFDGLAGAAGSATCRNDVDETLANFSNFGPAVDIAAPGVCILSTWNDGGLNTISGTSMASPHVAGAVALYLHAKGVLPATDAEGVDLIEQAILDAALPQSHACSYINEHAGSGSVEPLLFVNGAAFGGNGDCEEAGLPISVTDIAITAVSAPSSASIGDIVSVDVTVDNAGNQDVVTNIEVTLTDAADGIAIGTMIVNGGLTVGSTETVTFSWDTSGESEGNHLLTANHNFTDDDGSNNSGSTNVTLSVPGTSMHVVDLDGVTNVKGRSGKWEAFVTVTVHDTNGNPVSNATITASWSGDASGTVSGSTSSDGTVTLSTGNLSSGNSVTFTVDDVAHGSLAYDSGANTDPDLSDGSDGTTITIPK
jgi:hypothetical protein